MTTLHIAYLLFVLFALGDSALTLYVLSHGGSEVNPFEAWLGGKIGAPAAQVVTKAALFVAAWFFVKNLWGMVTLAATFAAVVAWNSYQASKTPA
jgi:hypothetical protein